MIYFFSIFLSYTKHKTTSIKDNQTIKTNKNKAILTETIGVKKTVDVHILL